MPSNPSESARPPEPARSDAKPAAPAEAKPAPAEAKQREAQAAPVPSAAASGAPAQDQGQGHQLSARTGQFLVSVRNGETMLPIGAPPLQFPVIEKRLRESPDIDILDRVGFQGADGRRLADLMSSVPGVLVARMSEATAAQLLQQTQGRLIIERDQSLRLQDIQYRPVAMFAGLAAAPAFKATFTIRGSDGAPLKDAEVCLEGALSSAVGLSDERGQVSLSLPAETRQSIRSIGIRPRAACWSFYQPYPDISAEQPNLLSLRGLADWPALADLPKKETLGWGQKAMRLDRLPAHYRGQGIRLAIIDSGAATTHPELRHIRCGIDIAGKAREPGAWNEDELAHGSHVAGLIAGAASGAGMRGFAPDAEIHVCKVFPGGLLSQVVDALEYCISRHIDVVHLSLGGIEPSEILEQQLLRAKRSGVACIVAAGNSGGRIQYPASSAQVFTVAAIGQLAEFPPDSQHAQAATPFVDANGFFPASFSCYGPELDVCAPGVAIVSCMPPDQYAAWDGSSIAAAHVSGLAALVLAHHPDFLGRFNARGAERVERLFQLIRLSARSVGPGIPGRTGYGLPDAPAALGLLQPESLALSWRGMAAGMQGMPARPEPAGYGAYPAGLGAGMQRSGYGVFGS